MGIRELGLVFVSLLLCQLSFAQETKEAKGDSTKKPIEVTISIGGGAARFLGDVQDASKKATIHVIGNRTAFDFAFGIDLNRSFKANFNAIYGRLSGNENTFESHRNFDAQMVQAGLNVEYNFGGLYKDKLPVLNPFLIGGVYYSHYLNIATDLFAADGTEYNYWSDGRIRDIAEDATNADDAVNISRDFTYETFLAKRSIHTGSVSGGLGLDLHIARPFTVRFMSRYFHSFSDAIDGVDDGSIAEAKDGLFFTTLSLMVHPMAFLPEDKRPDSKYKHLIDFEKMDKEDSDADGIYDLSDLCAGTPKNVKVDKQGCPLDDDNDGIPNYRDKSPNSPSDQLVDQKGVPVNYKLVAQRWSESDDVYGISWDKKYDNPRFRKDEGYTVNVDVVSKKEEGQTNPKILRIPELRKEVINDSIIVYRLGVYEKYETVERKRKELASEGIYSAYAVPENVSIEAADNLSEIEVQDEEKVINSYGIRESIDVIKAGEALDNPQLDYIISRFDRYLFDRVPEEALVKHYLKAISAFLWDETVKSGSDSVFARLEKYPTVNYSGEVEGLAEFMKTASEMKVEEPVVSEETAVVEVEKATEKIEVEMVDTESISSADNQELRETESVETGTTVTRDIEDKPGATTERTTINTVGDPENEEKVEDVALAEPTEEEIIEVTKEAVAEPVKVEKPKPVEIEDPKDTQEIVEAVKTPVNPVNPIEPEVLTGEPLKEAIEQIRSTSKLKSQPRINYAPVKSKYKLADANDDQLISALEIQMVLEDILKGESAFSAETFNEMNAYFTDFTQNVEPIDFGGTKVAFVNGTLTILKTEGGEYKPESRRLLAKKYREADFDKDGELTPEEVQKMIDLFMKGGSPYSQEKLHELIDLYFD